MSNSYCARIEPSELEGDKPESRPWPEIRPLSQRTLNRDCTVELKGYQVQFAGESDRLREEVDRLVADRYNSRGLDLSEETQICSESDKVTIVVSDDQRVLATLTLCIDSPSGLFADMLYPRETAKLRDNGGRLCEVTRLAVDAQSNSPEAMAALFNVAFILSYCVFTRTDLLAEVHPRHAGFYRRTMGYRVAGPKRFCARVGAPAMLMHMRLGFAGDLIREFAGTEVNQDRNLYRLFVPPTEHDALLQQLTRPETVADASLRAESIRILNEQCQ